VALPWGVRQHGPTDRVTHACAELLMQRGAARERITDGVFRGCHRDGIERVERAFALAHEVAPLAGKEAGLLTPGEAAQLREAGEAVRAAIRVDDFAAAELFQHGGTRERPARSAQHA
jgi:acyl-CoA dehydrogenase